MTRASSARMPAAKRAYPRRSDLTRLIQTLRANGINPSTVVIRSDGSIEFGTGDAARSTGGLTGKPSDFDVWNAAGKL